MIKLCLNCRTENALDAISCSECGMSLIRAPTGISASSLQDEIPRGGPDSSAANTEHAPRHHAPLALAIIWAVCTTLFLAGAVHWAQSMRQLGPDAVHWVPPGPRAPTAVDWLKEVVVPVLIPWAIVFIVWRRPAAGALALMAGGLLHLLLLCHLGLLMFWYTPTCPFLPTFFTLLPLAAGALMAVERTRGPTPE